MMFCYITLIELTSISKLESASVFPSTGLGKFLFILRSAGGIIAVEKYLFIVAGIVVVVVVIAGTIISFLSTCVFLLNLLLL